MPWLRCAASCLAVAFGGAVAAPAGAQTPAELAAPASEFEAAPPRTWSPRLDLAPGWAVGVDALTGVAVLATTSRAEAHGVVQGVLRARLGYAQLGALVEQTDHNEQEWRSLGGFVGAVLPYRNWVDLELSAGLLTRRFRSSDPRYGAGGYDVSNLALSLRAGISDRTTERIFGIRLGAHLGVTSDLAPRDEPWRYNLGTSAVPDFEEGTTRVGGHSVTLLVAGGFEIAALPRPVRASP